MTDTQSISVVPGDVAGAAAAPADDDADVVDPPRPPPKRWSAGTLTYTTTSLAVLFFFLLWGDFALALKERSVPQVLPLLLKQFHASNFTVAALLGFLPQAMAVALLPVISYRSDRHRGRWGRRIPFLLFPTPLAVLSMVGLAYSPVIGQWLHLTLGAGALGPEAAALWSLAAFWMMFEFASVVCSAVFTGLINDVVPREVIGRFYGLFRIFSLGAGMMFNFYLFGHAQAHYVAIFLGIAALYGVSFTAMCLKVREGEYPPPEETHASRNGSPAPTTRGGVGRRQSLRAAVVTYCRECFSDRFYLWYFASIALANMAFQPILLFSVYFAQSVGMSMETLGRYTTLQLFCSLVQAFPLGWLADKIHPLRVTIMALALYLSTTLLAFLFVRDASMFGIAHVACGTVAGVWLTATAPLGPALLPREKFAQFTSATWLCSSLGAMFVGPASGWFLDRTGHQYHYIFLWACVFTTGSLICALMLLRRVNVTRPRAHA